METTGDRVKKIRTLKNLTQEEFASKLDVSKQTISGIEKNRNFFSQSSLEKLVSSFNVNLNYIISGIGEPFLDGLKIEDTFSASDFDTNEPLKTIGKRFRHFMAFNKLNNLELHQLTGIAENRINDICLHNKLPHINDLIALKNKYAFLSADWLLFNVIPTNNSNNSSSVTFTPEEIEKLKNLAKFI